MLSCAVLLHSFFPPLFHTGLPCSLLPPMYMSSFLTSSPVTWSKVRPSDETTAYLAPSYRLTSKLTPSYSKREAYEELHSRTHRHTPSSLFFPPVNIRAEELMLTICSQSTNTLQWQAPTLEGLQSVRACAEQCSCEECEADACGQMRATPNIFTVI